MPPFCGRIHSSEHAPPESLFFFFNDTATTEIYTLSLHDALPILIIALRITTGGLGCRAYVDGYCGRATLVLSGVALAAAVAGAKGARPGRVPPPPPADAHAPVSASAVPTHAKPGLPGREPGTGFRRLGVNSWSGTSSRGHNDRMLGPPSPGLLDELDDEWLPHELRFEQTSRRICADV